MYNVQIAQSYMLQYLFGNDIWFVEETNVFVFYRHVLVIGSVQQPWYII